jgi:hypothetical protein
MKKMYGSKQNFPEFALTSSLKQFEPVIWREMCALCTDRRRGSLIKESVEGIKNLLEVSGVI